MYALTIICILVYCISFISAKRFYNIFDKEYYPIGRIIPVSGLVIGIALYFDIRPDELYYGAVKVDGLFIAIYPCITGTFVNTISYLYGKRQYHDQTSKNTAGYAFLTLFNIIGFIGSVLGIIELYLKHKI